MDDFNKAIDVLDELLDRRSKIRKCACCGEKFKITCAESDWAWKLDGKFYCRYSCYSKEFDKNYKASRVCIGMNRVNTGTRTRVVDNYERIR